MKRESRARARLSDVAARADVSRATVSRALRSDPRISAATTQRVKQAARDLHYIPDPVMSRWAGNAWKSRRSDNSGYEIAFVSEWPEIRNIACWPSAKQRAAELGYRLQIYSLEKLGSWKRLNQIIHAKSIPGVLLDKWLTSMPMELDVSNLAVVSCGVGMEFPFHSVRLDTFRQMEIMWNRIYQRGGKRVFLWLQETSHSLHGRLHYGASLECERTYRPHVKLVRTEFDWILPELLIRNVLDAKADTVVSLVNNHVPELEAALRREGWTGDWLLMRTIPGEGYSGILPHDDLVGIQSVNLLDRLIRDFETGMPANPLQVMVSPDWHEEPAGHAVAG